MAGIKERESRPGGGLRLPQASRRGPAVVLPLGWGEPLWPGEPLDRPGTTLNLRDTVGEKSRERKGL